MEKLISFVIPVYNVEKYLKECIESILKQCTNQCEIILVDDGSTDKSREICDIYASKENSINVIHQENGGLSFARNEGLKKAVGKYVAFVDSDDRIRENSLCNILKWIKQSDSDICFMDAIKFYSDGKELPLGDNIIKQSVEGKDKTEVLRHIATRPKYPGSACTKLFRREFLLENDIFFPSDRRVSEDLGYCLDAIMKAEKFDALDITYYEYRQNREGSITNKTSYKNFEDLVLFVIEWTQKFTIEKKAIGINEQYAMSNVAYEYSILCWQLSKLKKEERRRALLFLKEYKWVLNYGKTKKIKMIRLLSNLCGFVCTSVILNMYMKWR